MKLARDEFKSLITIKWLERVSASGQIYYVPINETANRLFNLDLLIKIFLNKFKNQKAIMKILNYDIAYPITLYPDLTVVLPSSLEAIVCFADKQNEHKVTDTLTINFNGYYVLFLTIILYITVYIIYYFGKKHDYSKLSDALRIKIL